MALETLIPAAQTDVISLASVKAMLGVDGTDDDAVLGFNIRAMTSGVRQFFGRELAFQQYLETFDYERSPGRARDTIKLACNPIDPGTFSMSLNGFPLTSWYVDDAEAGLLKRDQSFAAFSASGTYPVTPSAWRIAVTYSGGFAYGTAAWTPATQVSVGSWVRGSSPSVLRYVCTTAGTTGATEPTWPASGLTVVDGTTPTAAVWTARRVEELPEIVSLLTYFAIRDAFEAADRPSDVIRSEGEGFLEMYARSGAAGTISTEVLAGLAPLRLTYGRT